MFRIGFVSRRFLEHLNFVSFRIVFVSCRCLEHLNFVAFRILFVSRRCLEHLNFVSFRIVSVSRRCNEHLDFVSFSIIFISRRCLEYLIFFSFRIVFVSRRCKTKIQTKTTNLSLLQRCKLLTKQRSRNDSELKCFELSRYVKFKERSMNCESLRKLQIDSMIRTFVTVQDTAKTTIQNQNLYITL